MEQKFKRIYFVRHGQTDGNAKNIYQHSDTALSVLGEKQAVFVGLRFKDVPVDRIISSDYNRTKQTAETIAKVNGAHVEFSPLFREIRRPSDIRGKEKSEPPVKKIFDEMLSHECEPDWHHLDEENLFDVEKRAREALKFLRERPENELIVVTHEMFLKMLISAMAEEESARAVDFLRAIRYFMLGDNTGITIAEYGDSGFGKRFRLRIWNDHTHLG